MSVAFGNRLGGLTAIYSLNEELPRSRSVRYHTSLQFEDVLHGRREVPMRCVVGTSTQRRTNIDISQLHLIRRQPLRAINMCLNFER